MRRATTSDIAIILSFCLELKEQNAKMTFTSFDRHDIIKDYLENEQHFLYIALVDGVVAAMFSAKRGTGNKSHSVYVACAVRKANRKQNYATKITEYGLLDLKAQGVKIARTYIYSWNKASIATIIKCGFEEAGRVFMHQYEPDLGEYIDDLLFHRLL